MRRAAALAFALAACGSGGTTGPSTPAGGQIIIAGYLHTPQRLEVTPGTVVQVINLDDFDHELVTAATPDGTSYGLVAGIGFQTPPFTGVLPIVIPAEAPPGTVIPYFCPLHILPEDRGEIAVVAPP